MTELKEIKKYTFTVEGETEKLYFDWLGKQINACKDADYRVSIVTKVQQNPGKFAKSQVAFTTPRIVHICDIESNDEEHVKKFTNVLDQISSANKQRKNIRYNLGYSNYTFELWMALHKTNCNAPLSHRTQYLSYINKAFGEHFRDLDQYKERENFTRCLSKLTLTDVKAAIDRSQQIMADNESDPGKKFINYKGFKYYEENPSLTIWEHVKKILDECGIR